MINPPESTAEGPDRAETVARLHEALIRELREMKAIPTPDLERALRAVPRHLFVSEEPRVMDYAAEHHVVTKLVECGVNISSVSTACVQAFMAEQAGIRTGMRVLRIGSGGYNVVLLAELVGTSGEVTTTDIAPDVVNRARRLLLRAGYDRVNVTLTDGEQGEPEHGPYDRILVTVGAWDIPPAWMEQLTDAGRIVVPLLMRGLARSVTFDREGDRLVSRDYQVCGFVPMPGVGENRMRLVLLHGEEGTEVGLRLDDNQQADAERLREALHQPHTEVWTGVAVGGFEPNDNLDLWLATALDGFALLIAKPGARERNLVVSVSPLGVATLVDADSFAYRTARPIDEERNLYELGVYAHGPNAKELAARLAEQIQVWDREHRYDAARIEIHPAGTPDDQLPEGRVIDKRHSRITISWPSQQR